ncbi:hypothetical protein F2Q70_00001374 [Brassica cretica]|uniref:Secreted protein n=1 Tax=Brassica cretica TaxID=69181 RepID=A0A8S9IQ02_BRACR|nr:hypothetical protein F2Q70_00001374 [Brassica cretica]
MLLAGFVMAVACGWGWNVCGSIQQRSDSIGLQHPKEEQSWRDYTFFSLTSPNLNPSLPSSPFSLPMTTLSDLLPSRSRRGSTTKRNHQHYVFSVRNSNAKFDKHA